MGSASASARRRASRGNRCQSRRGGAYETPGAATGSARAKALWHTRYHDLSAEAAMSAGGTAAAAANLKITSDW